MSRSNADLLALKAELTNDPLTLGLTALEADDVANADKLNLARDTINVKKRSVSMASIFNAIKDTEHQALSDQQARWLDTLVRTGTLDPFVHTNALDGLDNMFGEESDSRLAIHALLTTSGSRITQLFQLGTITFSDTVTPSDIANARNAVA